MVREIGFMVLQFGGNLHNTSTTTLHNIPHATLLRPYAATFPIGMAIGFDW